MARRPSSPTPQPATFTADQMRQGIRELERRLKELKEVDFSNFILVDENRLKALAASVNATLASVFPPGTTEHTNFYIGSLWRASVAISDYGSRQSIASESLAGWKEGFAYGVAKLEAAIKYLKEKLEDMGETTGGRASIALQNLSLHPTIQSAVQKKFADGHYADAIETACKILNNLVQNKSGVFDIDNSKLMQKVFSRDNPILKFNDGSSEDLKNEQQGMMFLFCGAIQGLRNPRAHRVIDDHPEMALEALCFISMLAKYLDATNKVE